MDINRFVFSNWNETAISSIPLLLFGFAIGLGVFCYLTRAHSDYGWIPPSPISRWKPVHAVYISIFIFASYLFMIRHSFWDISLSVQKSQTENGGEWEFQQFPLGNTIKLQGSPKRLSYSYTCGKAGTFFIYYLSFANGSEFRTANLNPKEARKFQSYLLINAPEAEWIQKAYFD